MYLCEWYLVENLKTLHIKDFRIPCMHLYFLSKDLEQPIRWIKLSEILFRIVDVGDNINLVATAKLYPFKCSLFCEMVFYMIQWNAQIFLETYGNLDKPMSCRENLCN